MILVLDARLSNCLHSDDFIVLIKGNTFNKPDCPTMVPHRSLKKAKVGELGLDLQANMDVSILLPVSKVAHTTPELD